MRNTELVRVMLCVVIVLCVFKSVVVAGEHDLALILLSKSDRAILFDVQHEIEKMGGRALHVFPPDALVATVSERAISALRNDPRIARVSREPIASFRGTKIQSIAVQAWEKVLQNRLAIAQGLYKTSRSATQAQSMQQEQWRTAPPDVLVPPREAFTVPRSVRQSTSSSVPYGADFYDTSEFFFGSVSIGVLIVESAGNAYNWSNSHITETLNGIVAGMDWWVAREPRANLTFVYDIHERVPISAEPIQGSIGDDVTWGAEALAALGYSDDGGVFYNARKYLNDIRSANQTNWATMMFVVESDPAVNLGRFAIGGGYAHSYYGGPWLTMARYSTWAYNFENYFTCVPAHETGHNFYTTDEYNSVKEHGGYFNGPDQDGAECIMNQNSLDGVCDSSRLQLGWRFTGNEFDILNVRPTISLESHIPNPTIDHTPSYNGTAVVGLLPNNNPYGQRHAISLNTITGVEYSLDLSQWLSTTASNPGWDTGSESFSFISSVLPAGTYTFSVRATDNRGSSSDNASDLLAITNSTVTVGEDWNLISSPFRVQDARATILFPGATSSPFAFDGRYITQDTINHGLGYWLKFSAADSIAIDGSELLDDTVHVHGGWNIIGSLAEPFPVNELVAVPPLVVLSSVYGYSSGFGYLPVGLIEPGKGYWIRVNGAGNITMHVPPSGAASAAQTLVMPGQSSDFSRLTFADSTGKVRTLLFTTCATLVHPEYYELPPPIPSSVFDVRFTSQRGIEILSSSSTGLLIETQAVHGPLYVSWKIAWTDRGTILDAGGQSVSPLQLYGTGTAILNEPAADRMTLRLEDQVTHGVARQFALYQSYPNPFNPTTEIVYELAEEARVTLTISDLIGRQVVTLVDNVESEGMHRVVWNAETNQLTAAASGMYFYTIVATPTLNGARRMSTDTRKMLLVR
ncbi:MAG: T9SS type A sorting domain-containing protein [Ignavibacteriae bacterium]|nr:T9SS type A sorting domain-containing protein [Ignavibacteriota bacterium]